MTAPLITCDKEVQIVQIIATVIRHSLYILLVYFSTWNCAMFCESEENNGKFVELTCTSGVTDQKYTKTPPHFLKEPQHELPLF